MKKIIGVIALLATLVSCDYFNRKQEEQPIARVKDKYLYSQEIKSILPFGISSKDSTIIVNAYINRWARQHLLMEGAQRNLTVAQQGEFQELVEQYRNDLFTKAYLDGLVLQSIDTIVSMEEASLFYEANKESFKLNQNLLRLRYINMAQSALNIAEVTERFQRFDSLDRVVLDSISMQFNSVYLNDSVWVNVNEVLNKVPVIQEEQKEQLLKISNILQLKDSINLYLIKVVDVRSQYDYAPLPYVLPTVNEMVLNKRKLELTKEFENDILKDAIRTKEFEIYE